MLAQVPFYYVFSTTKNLALFIISAMIYGSTFYTFRNSTIFKNLQETKLTKKEIYGSIFISMFIFTGIMYFFCIGLFVFLIAINSSLLIDNWFFAQLGIGSGGTYLNQLNIQLLIWWYFAFIFLNFGLFYLFQNISNTKKGFYLFIFLYLVLLIIYGNIANTPAMVIKYDNLFDAYSNWSSYLEQEYQITNIDKEEAKIILRHYYIPGKIYVQNNVGEKYQKGHYVTATACIIVPHSWINSFCLGIWKCTALKSKDLSYIWKWRKNYC